MVLLASWGRTDVRDHAVVNLKTPGSVASEIKAEALPGVVYGAGRSYGDICLNAGGTAWKTQALDHMIALDLEQGILRVEAGVLLRDINRSMSRYGLALPVTPGTQFVTVGGAIANDVHGKNQQCRGSFGDHVRHIRLQRTDGTILECGPGENREWFAATVGGLGLTGIILEADIALRRHKSPWLEIENIPFDDLATFFDLAGQDMDHWEYTVGWFDCLDPKGRGIFSRARPETNDIPDAPIRDGRLAVPFVVPLSLVNTASVRLFNRLYFAGKSWGKGRSIIHCEKLFYPLDGIRNWNFIYGPRGFYQYQCVIPTESARPAILDMHRRISASGEGSFLAVIKTFGERLPQGLLSFPRPGVTLALDFPNKGASTLRLFAELDRIVADAGGRLYAAKDARMPRELFEAGYPNLEKFIEFRDPGISSQMSRRLLGS